MSEMYARRCKTGAPEIMDHTLWLRFFQNFLFKCLHYFFLFFFFFFFYFFSYFLFYLFFFFFFFFGCLRHSNFIRLEGVGAQVKLKHQLNRYQVVFAQKSIFSGNISFKQTKWSKLQQRMPLYSSWQTKKARKHQVGIDFWKLKRNGVVCEWIAVCLKRY